jgi:hypothetical protein
MARQPVGRTDQKVARTNSGVADLESKDSSFSFGGRLATDRLLYDGIECGV